MKTLRIRENLPQRQSLIDAKTKFLQDLREALAKEKTIAGLISRVERVPKPAVADSQDIQVGFGYMDNFVRHVFEKRTHVKNAEKLEALIANATNELQVMRNPPAAPVTTKTTLNIHYRNGTIKPTEKIAANSLEKYHWEMQSGAQSWSQLGAKGDPDINPGLSDGQVRLSYSDGQLLSNKIKLSTVIKRQAGSAKRKQYRLEPGDAEFEQRCKGVAGRIKRLMTPPRHIVDADFGTRVFQDRVAQLPEHLDLSVLEVIELCETGTTADSDYVHMIEFVEPTVYLNPRKLHSELKDIYEGKRISLQLPVVGGVREEAAELARRVARLDVSQRQQREQRAREDAARREAERLQAEEVARLERERLAREREEAAERVRQEAAARAEEVRVAEQRAAETAARIARERELLEQQQRAANRQVMKVYATKKAGVAASGPDTWFMTVDEKVYQNSSTGKSATKKSFADADAAGWSVDDAAVALAKEERENARKLAREQKRLAEEASAAEKAAEAERERLVAEEEAAKAAEAEAERERLVAEEEATKAAEAEAERVRQDAEERAALIAALREDTEQLAFVKYVFTTYDTDGNGQITVSELTDALRRVGRDGSAAEQLVLDNDLDTNGTIDEEEFIEWCAVSRVMEDKSWKDAEIEFKAKQLATTGGESKSSETQESTFQSVVVNQILPYFIGDVAKVRATIGASTNKSAWETENTVQELTTEIQTDFIVPLEEWLKATGADAWLGASDIVEYSKANSVRVFYVPADASKEFAVTPRSRREKQYINAKAICTIDVEKNIFEADGGRSARGDVFVLKDIATKDRGAKFLLASALEKMQDDNPAVQTLLTQPFNGDGFEGRAAKFASWGLRSIPAKLPATATPVNNLMMLGEEDSQEWSAPKPGELSAMIENMTDDWVSSDEELNFAEQSENESMDFAASSALDTDSDLDFAQSSERSVQANSSEEESSERGKTSSGMEFAESSAAESDSDMEFAETSDKTSSGLEFAESSAVESD